MATEIMQVESFNVNPSFPAANALYHRAVATLDAAYRGRGISWIDYITLLIDLDNGYFGDVSNAEACAACQTCLTAVANLLSKEQVS